MEENWLNIGYAALYKQAVATKTYLANRQNNLGCGSEEWLRDVFVPITEAFIDSYRPKREGRSAVYDNPYRYTDSQTMFRNVYGKFYNDYIKDNPNIMPQDLIAMGILHTSPGAVNLVPEAALSFMERISLSVHFRSKGAATKAKPAGITAVEIAYSVLDKPPASLDELENKVIAATTPHRLYLPNMRHGDNVYVALRWVKRSGKKMLWSKIYSIAVP